MRNSRKWLRRLTVLAGLAVVVASTPAFVYDAQIMIDRALNSPTLTIRYSGASVALVELRLNGKSLGTRPVSAARSSGETNFTLDLSSLTDGDNEIEVRLFDRSGKLVGTERSTVTTDENRGPVFISSPRVGATVQGPVEIRVGFGREMRNAYVSFFVNNQVKSMVNTPPFTYLWDTSREQNGWHEVEAWVIDEASNTFKTRKVRVFVNNPGGRTDRRVATPPVAAPVKTAPPAVVPAPKPVTNPVSNQVRGTATGSEAGLRTGATPAGTAVTTPTGPATPRVSAVEARNAVRGNVLGAPSGTKTTPIGTSVATGPKDLTPTGTRNAAVKTVAVRTTPAAATTAVRNVTSAARTISITKGQRIPNLASFAVVLNSQFVEFDVNPRVDNGVPMTPFRHLIEKAGGTVDWQNDQKAVEATAEGRNLVLQIGERTAKIDKLPVSLEVAPYLDRGRTIVPLSFIRDFLKVNIEFDRETGHVLITSVKK